jgi:parallel beta helix pectate lyase-like protein
MLFAKWSSFIGIGMKFRNILSTSCLAIILFGCNSDNESVNELISNTVHYPSDGNASLQEVIDNLPNEGTVIIDAGLFKENITITNKVVHLEGKGKQSIIDGQGGTCITIENSSGASISNMSIINGDDGISTDSLIMISGNYFFNNTDGVDYEGGGGTLVNNLFHANKDDAIDLDYDVSVNISNNVISNSSDDGIEIRLHPYNGDELKITISNNIFDGSSNGIQFIDYEEDTNRSFNITGNTFLSSEYSDIAYSDNQVTLPSHDVGTISEEVTISNNVFYPLVFSFTGSGNESYLDGNFIYSLTGDGGFNTNNDFVIGDNTIIQLN